MFDPAQENQYEVEEIVDQKLINGEILYEVKWKGYPSSENTFEPLYNLKEAPEQIELWNYKKKKLDKLKGHSHRNTSDEEEFVYQGSKKLKLTSRPQPQAVSSRASKSKSKQRHPANPSCKKLSESVNDSKDTADPNNTSSVNSAQLSLEKLYKEIEWIQKFDRKKQAKQEKKKRKQQCKSGGLQQFPTSNDQINKKSKDLHLKLNTGKVDQKICNQKVKCANPKTFSENQKMQSVAMGNLFNNQSKNKVDTQCPDTKSSFPCVSFQPSDVLKKTHQNSLQKQSQTSALKQKNTLLGRLLTKQNQQSTLQKEKRSDNFYSQMMLPSEQQDPKFQELIKRATVSQELSNGKTSEGSKETPKPSQFKYSQQYDISSSTTPYLTPSASKKWQIDTYDVIEISSDGERKGKKAKEICLIDENSEQKVEESSQSDSNAEEGMGKRHLESQGYNSDPVKKLKRDFEQVDELLRSEDQDKKRQPFKRTGQGKTGPILSSKIDLSVIESQDQKARPSESKAVQESLFLSSVPQTQKVHLSEQDQRISDLFGEIEMFFKYHHTKWWLRSLSQQLGQIQANCEGEGVAPPSSIRDLDDSWDLQFPFEEAPYTKFEEYNHFVTDLVAPDMVTHEEDILEEVADIVNEIEDWFMKKYHKATVEYYAKKQIALLVNRIAYEGLNFEQGLEHIEKWMEKRGQSQTVEVLEEEGYQYPVVGEDKYALKGQIENKWERKKFENQKLTCLKMIQEKWEHQQRQQKLFNSEKLENSNALTKPADPSRVPFDPRIRKQPFNKAKQQDGLKLINNGNNRSSQLSQFKNKQQSQTKKVKIINNDQIESIVKQFEHRGEKCFKLLLKNGKIVNVKYDNIKQSCANLLAEYYEKIIDEQCRQSRWEHQIKNQSPSQ